MQTARGPRNGSQKAGTSGPLGPARRPTRQADGSKQAFDVMARLDTPVDVKYYRNGGILHTVLRKMLAGSQH